MFEREPRTGPRPIAEPRIEALANSGQELAKRWLLELLAALPLDAAGRVPVNELAGEGPLLCSAVLRALGGDGELWRLEPGGDRHTLAARAGQLAGASDAAGAVAAVEALRRVLWAALEDDLRPTDARLAGDVASRLARVCSTVAAAAVAALSAGVAPAAPADARPVRDAGDERDAGDARDDEPGAQEGGRLVALTRPRVLAGEGAPAAPEADAPETDAAPEAGAAPAAGPAEAVVQPTFSGFVAARDAREAERGEGAAAWIHSIGRRLERHAQDGRPFAVLLIELDGAQRLERAEIGGDVADLVESVERTLGAILRPADVLARESFGRYWLVTPETDRAGADALAQRIAVSVEAAGTHRGTPLRVGVGIAVCPEDGGEASELAARADLALFAARAAGDRGTPSPS